MCRQGVGAKWGLSLHPRARASQDKEVPIVAGAPSPVPGLPGPSPATRLWTGWPPELCEVYGCGQPVRGRCRPPATIGHRMGRGVPPCAGHGRGALRSTRPCRRAPLHIPAAPSSYAGGWWARLTGGHSSPAGTAHRSPPHGAFHPLPEEPLTHPPPVPAGWCPSAAGVCRDPHVGTTVGAGNPPAQRGGPQPDGGCGPGQGLTPTAFIGSMYRAATPSLCPPHLAECWSSERPPPVPALCPPASG